jgi:hypothetical protein
VRDRCAAIALVALAGCTAVPVPDDARSCDALEGADAGCVPVDFVAALADPLAPARSLPGHAFLLSSRDPEPQPGLRNDDLGHFIGMDGGRAILADEVGPGVITRLWFTYGPTTLGPIDDVPLRLTIDGHDVFTDVRLGDLAGASSTVFPLPWSMDPSIASGGLDILAPIQFQQSARVELTVAPGSWAYYQVDVRRLPPCNCVRSFDGTFTADETRALAAAAAIWHDHGHPGDDHTVATRTLSQGDTIDLALDGVGAITTLEVISPEASRAELSLRIEIDGDVAADAALGWLTGSSAPAGHYSAALTASTTTSAILYAPIPYATHAHVIVTSHATVPVDVGLRVRAMTMSSLASDVGRFHAVCSSATVSIPIATEQPPYPDMFPNVVLAQSPPGPGQFAGITTFQTAPDPWWWSLEPDHEIAIDGSYPILGTGTEDYFGGAYYFEGGPYASMTSGASGWSRPDGTVHPIPDAHTHVYRHHLVDTWPYDHDLRFEFESYVNGTRWDGCAFFYTFAHP